MKNILLNSCYPPPTPAAKEAPSPVSSLSQLVPRHTLQRTECAPGQHRSRARSVPEVATEVSQRRRCPSSPAGAVLELRRAPSVPQPRAAGAAVSPLPGGRSALVPSPRQHLASSVIHSDAQLDFLFVFYIVATPLVTPEHQ